jgi:hypothetical protein
VPADAQIVYTPSNILLAEPTYRHLATTGLDINNDGIADFQFGAYYSITILTTSARFNGGDGSDRFLQIAPLQVGNGVMSKPQKGGLLQVTAQALPIGVKVGSSASFSSKNVAMAEIAAGNYSQFYSGSWINVQTAYLGLRVVIDGAIHYGWARIKFVYPGRAAKGEYAYTGFLTGNISGYAYESAPNQAILTGQTSDDELQQSQVPPDHPLLKRANNSASLGMLAAGSPGLRMRQNNSASTLVSTK